jgi:hypothetical protein
MQIIKMKSKSIHLYILSLGLVLSSLSFAVSAQTIPVHKLSAAPTLDGSDADWASIPATRVSLTSLRSDSKVEAIQVEVKAGYNDSEIFFYFEWVDTDQNMQHKPYVWDEARGKYSRGPQREDRLALQFQISGEFSPDWRNVQESTTDMWHWKSVRSNPIGLVHDKLVQISSSRLLRSSEIEGHNGPVYVLRTSDAGDKIYTTKRYSKKDQPVMPKYILNPDATGSATDIRAKGIWSGDHWHLELRRKLNTGHDDDVVFLPGQTVKGAIAVFDGSENDDHNISNSLEFQL